MTKDLSLSEQQLLKWNELKKRLTIVELLSTAISTSLVRWDKDCAIRSGCIEECFERISEVEIRHYKWLANICLSDGDYDKVWKLWKMLTENSETTQEEVIALYRSLAKHKAQQRDRFNPNLSKLFLKILEKGELPKEHLDLASDIIAFYTTQKNHKLDYIKSIHEKYFEAIKENKDDVENFFRYTNQDYLVRYGLFEKVILQLFENGSVYEGVLCSAIEPEKKTEATYKKALEYILEKAPVAAENFRVDTYKAFLKLLEPEDAEKVKAATHKGLLEVIYLITVFSKEYDALQEAAK